MVWTAARVEGLPRRGPMTPEVRSFPGKGLTLPLPGFLPGERTGSSPDVWLCSHSFQEGRGTSGGGEFPCLSPLGKEAHLIQAILVGAAVLISALVVIALNLPDRED